MKNNKKNQSHVGGARPVTGRPQNYAREMSFVYGDQTWGRAFKDITKDFFLGEKAINSATNYIQESLDVLKITPKRLRGMTVLDVGTGRQALKFHYLGAKEILHFDISRSHVEQTRAYCKEHKIKNITSVQGDLTKDKLPAKKFDLVFAAGIYQHLNPAPLGLINFAQSLKVGGQMYMGFYRSGDWRWFIVSLIREAIAREDFAAAKRKIAISSALGDGEHFQVARVLDDFFVPAQSLFHPKDILSDPKICGLDKYYLENDLRDYCHEGKGYHTVGGDRVYAVKKTHHSYESLLNKNFATARSIDQLRDINYKEPLIKENIKRWLGLVDLYHHGFIDRDTWLDILVNVYRFARPWDTERDDYYSRGESAGRHKTLNDFLVKVANNFSK